MINVYAVRNSGVTTISIHRGEGTPDETLIMSQDIASSVADDVIGDLLDGAVTVHGEGA